MLPRMIDEQDNRETVCFSLVPVAVTGELRRDDAIMLIIDLVILADLWLFPNPLDAPFVLSVEWEQ